MSLPHRVQRQRTKGWKMPPNTIYVGRPTKWGNEHRASDYGFDVDECLRQYRADIALLVEQRELDLEELRGKNLACWCGLDEPCHADVLIELSNKEATP